MNASAYQMMRAEIKQLEKTGADQQAVIQQLVQMLQQARVETSGERITGMINLLAFGGSITVSQALIDEVSAKPYAYDVVLRKDEESGDQTMVVTKKSDEAIAEIETKLQEQQQAIAKAQAEQASATAIVAPDGSPARESAGKLVLAGPSVKRRRLVHEPINA